ncbi:hypothetical protein FQR65_LT01607 [Abscondita terminalis]|nr:hypothetical protein FQR65_LT01607 [Abscondita terminalis]
MDTTSNGHNAKTWTQRQNKLLDTSPKLDTSSKSVIGHIVENGHNVEKQKLTLHGSEIWRRSRADGHNTEIWTQRRNPKLGISSHMDPTSKNNTEEPDISPNDRHNFWIVDIAN